jgi:hypothetical protein
MRHSGNAAYACAQTDFNVAKVFPSDDGKTAKHVIARSDSDVAILFWHKIALLKIGD